MASSTVASSMSAMDQATVEGRASRVEGFGARCLALDPRLSTLDFDFQNVLAIAAAIAVGAADEDVAEELHLDLLKPGAATAFALAVGGIEAERAGVEAALLGRFGLRKDFADVVERADVNGGVGARGFAEGGLVHEHDLAEGLEAGEADAECGVRSGESSSSALAGFRRSRAGRRLLRVLAWIFSFAAQSGKQDVADERGFARAADAGEGRRSDSAESRPRDFWRLWREALAMLNVAADVRRFRLFR